MRHRLIAILAALTMLLSLAGVASADEPDPCVPGVAVYQFTNADTNNVIEVTKTTTCTLLEDGTIDTDYTYEYRTVRQWVEGRYGGYYADEGGADLPWWMRR